MFKYFKIKTSSIFNGKVEKFNIILIIFNEHKIEILKKDSIWHNDRAGYEVLKNHSYDKEININETPLVVILDNNFTIRNISLDREFFGFIINSLSRSRYLDNRVPVLIKQGFVEVIKLMQKTMKTNEVSMSDFIAQITKNSVKKEITIEWDINGMNVETVSFYLVDESDKNKLKIV